MVALIAAVLIQNRGSGPAQLPVPHLYVTPNNWVVIPQYHPARPAPIELSNSTQRQRAPTVLNELTMDIFTGCVRDDIHNFDPFRIRRQVLFIDPPREIDGFRPVRPASADRHSLPAQCC